MGHLRKHIWKASSSAGAYVRLHVNTCPRDFSGSSVILNFWGVQIYVFRANLVKKCPSLKSYINWNAFGWHDFVHIFWKLTSNATFPYQYFQKIFVCILVILYFLKSKIHFSNRFTGETILVVSLPMVTPHWVTLEDTFENLVVPRVHTSVYKWIPAPGTSQGVNQSYKQGQHCCSDRPDSTGLFFKNILLFAVIGHHNTLCGGRPQHFCCNREDICGLRSQQFVVARGHNTTTFTERLFGAWSFHNSALMKV